MEILNLSHSDIIALLVTLKLALTTCICLAIIGTPIAYFLAFSSSKGKSIIESIVTLPLVLPPTVIGFYLIIFFSPDTKLGQFFILLTGEQLVFSFWHLVFLGCRLSTTQPFPPDTHTPPPPTPPTRMTLPLDPSFITTDRAR